MLRFKADVRIGYFDPRMFDALALAARWSLLRRIDVCANSMNDPAQGRVANTLHDQDLAVDLSTVDERPADMYDFANYMRVQLPPGYDVVFEGNHLHVEYDAHRPTLRAIPG